MSTEPAGGFARSCAALAVNVLPTEMERQDAQKVFITTAGF
jgi:hypothetical protein